MRGEPIGRWVLMGISVSGLLLTGCNPQRMFGDTPAKSDSPQLSLEEQLQAHQPEVPYVPTPNEVVLKMLELAEVNSEDVLYDLGSGDGRIVIAAAAQYGARGVGIEINPDLVEQSQQNARAAGVDDRVDFFQQDLFETNLQAATVVTLYLLPEVNLRLRPKLFQELEPGTRIVSHDFDMGDWEPDQVVQVEGPTRQHTLYYWVMPEDVPEQLLLE